MDITTKFETIVARSSKVEDKIVGSLFLTYTITGDGVKDLDLKTVDEVMVEEMKKATSGND